MNPFLMSLLLAQVISSSEPTLKLLPQEGKTQLYRCEVANTSKVTWYFKGNSVVKVQPSMPSGRIVPVHIIQHLKDGIWVSQFDGRCGVGISTIELPPGATAWFDLYLPFFQKTESRVGLYMYYGKVGTGHRYVWSNAVQPPAK
jgi:hypothetical protein